MNNRNTFIDLFRIVAIMLIVIDHTFFMLGFNNLHDLGIVMGYIGVSIFFFLSGYLTKIKTSSKDFIIDKLIKLYPIYFVAMIGTLLTSEAVIYPYCEIIYTFLLQVFYPHTSKILWFMSGLMMAYILYAVRNINSKWFIILASIFFIEWCYIGNFRMHLMIILFFLGNYLSNYKILEFNWKPNKIINAIGSSTLVIYLFHVLILTGLYLITMEPFWVYSVFIPIVIISSVIIQKQYDKFTSWLKKQIRNKKQLKETFI